MTRQLGGEVEGSDHQEFGRAFLDIREPCALFEGLWQPGERHQVWMSHGDRVVRLPEGFRVVGTSEGAPCAAVADDARRYYGVQFHPEVMHTPDGAKLIANFAHRICGCAGDWTMAAFREQAIAAIRAQVGPEGRVICGLSGGVDSSVAAVLIHEAIGERLTCIFVDHGLLRAGEAAQVVEVFRDHYNIPGRPRRLGLFLANSPGSPTRSEAQDHRQHLHRGLRGGGGQEAAPTSGPGTLYPDVIESVSFTGGPRSPSRATTMSAACPSACAWRWSSPCASSSGRSARTRPRARPAGDAGRPHPSRAGPAIRIPGEVTREDCEILRKADAIYLEEIRKAGLYDAIWQAFAVLLPVRTVGVMGDARSYDKVCALRAVTSTDGMTADSTLRPHLPLPPWRPASSTRCAASTAWSTT